MQMPEPPSLQLVSDRHHAGSAAAVPAVAGRAAPLAGLPESQRTVALARFTLLKPHLEDGVPLTRVAAAAGVPPRTAQRWLARYRAAGLAGLARTPRRDQGRRRLPEELRLLIEGLALRRPAPSIAAVHRLVVEVAGAHGWPVPSYSRVYDIVRRLDPALVTLAHEGAKRYREVYDLVHRREAARPNEIWQADHTELDLWVLTPSGMPARPWLTVIEDDYSRAVCGYAVSLEAPSALQTALALRQAIWRKPDPAWQACGIPAVFYTDHGPDFTSQHLEQVAADLKIRLVFSLAGQPRGRGKIERLFDTINQMCLSVLPSYAPRSTPDRAGQARLGLSALDTAIGRFLTRDYHQRPHGETGQPPQQRWAAGGFLPNLPESLEQLDLLLLTVAKARKVHPDGIHFQGLRYLDATLAAYVGEPVTIRYDPRDLAELRVFHHDRFLCRAVCPELADQTVSLKDITAARNARRRELTHGIRERTSVVDRLIAVHQPEYLDPLPTQSAVPAAPDRQPPDVPRPRLKRYREE
jgi:putative transposase